MSLWDLLALMGFGGLWVYYLQVLPALPARVPTHFNAAGWTFNFARPMAWVIMGLLMAAILTSVLMSRTAP